MKILRKIETPIRFFHPAEDWVCSFLYNTVEVKVNFLHDCLAANLTKGLLQIVFSGAPTTSASFEMKKNIFFSLSEYEKELAKVLRWCYDVVPNPVTIAWLSSQGFRSFGSEQTENQHRKIKNADSTTLRCA